LERFGRSCGSLEIDRRRWGGLEGTGQSGRFERRRWRKLDRSILDHCGGADLLDHIIGHRVVVELVSFSVFSDGRPSRPRRGRSCGLAWLS
jgi:hypothetical protein